MEGFWRSASLTRLASDGRKLRWDKSIMVRDRLTSATLNRFSTLSRVGRNDGNASFRRSFPPNKLKKSVGLLLRSWLVVLLLLLLAILPLPLRSLLVS